MRKKVAAGNWKMHKSPAEARATVGELISGMGNPSCEVIVAPTALCLEAAVAAAAGSALKISAQNCYSQNQGAFTGEVSPAQLRQTGVTHCLLGHSERRHVFKESDGDINKKLALIIKENLIPIFCVGELLDERKAGKLEAVLERQIVYGLEGIDLPAPDKLLIAYEPVWAIGTGETATPEDAQQAHAFIRKLLEKAYGVAIAENIRILYGGSVKPDNTALLCAKGDVDGVLVGGASLEADSFLKIISAAG